jgi:hypothetical protein
MEHPEERYARLLYDNLIGRINPTNPDARISVSGAGVNWRCLVQFEARTSVTHCFEHRGEEYLTIFKENGQEIATARTQSSNATVEVVQGWIKSEALSSLYDRFEFVDQQKRELSQIRDIVERSAPDMRSGSELQYRGSGQYCLWFRGATRSALIHFYGKEESPRVICHWDACELFAFRADDVSLTSAVLRRWLCDGAAPSAMRKEFSWLSIGELADYYERGNPIEGEFISSWDRIERFYDNEHFPPRSRVLQFVRQLRSAGYDRKFRAGQSMWTLMLSRSRRHGLRDDQFRVTFEISWDVDSMAVTVRNRAEQSTLIASVSLSDEIRATLNRLLEIPVD